MKHRLSMVIALVLLAVASGCGANSAANPVRRYPHAAPAAIRAAERHPQP